MEGLTPEKIAAFDKLVAASGLPERYQAEKATETEGQGDSRTLSRRITQGKPTLAGENLRREDDLSAVEMRARQQKIRDSLVEGEQRAFDEGTDAQAIKPPKKGLGERISEFL